MITHPNTLVAYYNRALPATRITVVIIRLGEHHRKRRTFVKKSTCTKPILVIEGIMDIGVFIGGIA